MWRTHPWQHRRQSKWRYSTSKECEYFFSNPLSGFITQYRTMKWKKNGSSKTVYRNYILHVSTRILFLRYGGYKADIGYWVSLLRNLTFWRLWLKLESTEMWHLVVRVYPEDGSRTFLRKAGGFIPGYNLPYPDRQTDNNPLNIMCFWANWISEYV